MIVVEEQVAHGAAPTVQRDVEIGPAVVIVIDEVERVARGHFGEPDGFRHIGEFVAFVAVDADEDAAAGNDEILFAIAIDVAPGGGAVAVQVMDAELGRDIFEGQQGRVGGIDV